MPLPAAAAIATADADNDDNDMMMMVVVVVKTLSSVHFICTWSLFAIHSFYSRFAARLNFLVSDGVTVPTTIAVQYCVTLLYSDNIDVNLVGNSHWTDLY